MLGTDEANEMNGKRTLTKFNALNAAREIIGKWKNMSDPEVDKYLEDKFESQWAEKDYQKLGLMDVRDAYYWMRTLAGEEYFSA